MSGSSWFAIIAAGVGWGLGGVATRSALDEGLQPFALVAMRILMATALVVGYLVVKRTRLAGLRLWGVATILGITNLVMPFVFFTLALEHASAGFIGLLVSLVPAVTALFAHFLLAEERLRTATAIGLGVSFLGVGVLMATGETGIGAEGDALLAAVFALTAVASVSYSNVYGRRHTPGMPVIPLTAIQFIVGSIILVLAMLIGEGLPRGVTATGWWLTAYMAVVATIVPFAVFYWLLQRVTATQASLIAYLVPIIAVIGGVILLDEQVPPAMLGGGALIVIGVILTERAISRSVTLGRVAV